MMDCVICNEQIKEDIEQWVRLTDFSGKIKTGEVYYHLECWRERFKITNSERKKRMYAQTIGAFGNILNRGGFGDKDGGITIKR